jgi:PAS domain S-box-containing protein
LWVSRSGRVVDASPALCRLLNYSFNEILNLSSAPIDDLPETWDKRWQDFGLYLTETFPTNLRSKSGDLISVSTEARLCTGFETGDPCVLLRLTSTILRSVSQPRSVPTLPPSPFFEAMSEGVAFHRVLYNADHVAYDYEILDVNSKFTEIVGKSRDDVVGKFATEVYESAEPPYLDIYSQVAMTGRNARFEVYYPPLSKWLHISVTSLEQDCFVTIFSDITGPKAQAVENERLLKENVLKSAKLEAVFDSMSTGLIICDKIGSIVKFNSEASSILGFTSDNFPSTIGELKSSVCPRNMDGHLLPDDMHVFSEALKGERKRMLRMQIERNDGQTIVVSCCSAPVVSTDGEQLGAVVSYVESTERVRLQEKLKRHESMLKDQLAEMDFIVEHTPVGLFSLDKDFDLLRYNQSFSDIARLPIGTAPGRPLADLLPGLASSLEELRPLLFDQGVTVKNGEILNLLSRDDDFYRTWLASYYPRKDETGNVVGLLGAIVDITDNKMKEQELRKSSSLLERVEEISRMGYWEFDLRTGSTWASRVAREIYGINSDNITMQEVRQAALPEYQDKLGDALHNLVSHGATYDLEFQIKRQTDGSIVDLRSMAAYSSVEHKVTGVVQDITERNAAQVNLQKLFQAVEQNPASIVITGPTAKIEYVNPKFTEVTGYSSSEVIGKNPSVLKSENTERETYVDLWETVLAGNVWRGTFCNKSKSGENFWESASISPVFDTNGRLINYVAVKEDITARVNADIELAALNDRAVKRLRYIQAAHDVELKLRQTTSMPELIHSIVSELSSTLNMEAVALWKRDMNRASFRCVAEVVPDQYTGNQGQEADRARRIKRAVKTNKPINAIGSECFALGLPENIQCYGVLPLGSQGEIMWVLEYYTGHTVAYANEWLNCLETIGAVCALALHNTKLFEEVQTAHVELVDAYDATLEGWSRALDLRDRDTEGHSQRVTASAVKLARKLGLKEDAIIQVRRGALLHDIGKLGVPDRILGKPGKLTADEWDIMKLHPVYAYEWLSRIAFLRPALDIPRSHHEHWDGTGYPRGLKGEEIPIAARLFTIIDVWDALTHTRPYRAATPRETTRTYILNQSGKLFDPALVKIFIAMVDRGEIE